MKIIDILKHSAELLNLDDEASLMESATQEKDAELLKNVEIKKLFNLLKFSVQELCSNYLPVVTEQEFETENKSYLVANFPNFIRMQAVFKKDKTIKFKQVNRKLVFNEDGTFLAKYFTYPEINSMFDDLSFITCLNPDVLVFGLVSYYCLSKGMFDEFKLYNNTYMEKAESIKALKTIELPQRRWQ